MSSGIIRVAKGRENPYAQIPNAVFADSRLSYRTVGVLCYLLSKPNDWQVRVTDLQARHAISREGLRDSLKELEAAGYLARKRVQGEGGRFQGWETLIYENPVQHAVQPKDGLPTIGSPTVGFPPPSNTDLSKTEVTNTSPLPPAPLAGEGGEGLPALRVLTRDPQPEPVLATAASERPYDVARASAAADLKQFFGAPVLRQPRFAQHRQDYEARRDYWLDNLPAEFIKSVLRHARYGDGVIHNSFGAVITWLDQPKLTQTAIPAAWAALQAATASERPAPVKTARVERPGSYADATGRTWTVTSVDGHGNVWLSGREEPIDQLETVGWVEAVNS